MRREKRGGGGGSKPPLLPTTEPGGGGGEEQTPAASFPAAATGSGCALALSLLFATCNMHTPAGLLGPSEAEGGFGVHPPPRRPGRALLSVDGDFEGPSAPPSPSTDPPSMGGGWILVAAAVLLAVLACMARGAARPPRSKGGAPGPGWLLGSRKLSALGWWRWLGCKAATSLGGGFPR
uniref:Uncharacterized protein n=1 Tax=Hemiselmis tepida TaxID=464990 RepID=A0A7S0VU44_9CRYP